MTIDLWEGEFGDKYRQRNPLTDAMIVDRITLWGHIFRCINKFGHTLNRQNTLKILEIGAGIGSNLIAIQSIVNLYNEGDMINSPSKRNINLVLYAVEPNSAAAKELIINVQEKVNGQIYLIPRNACDVDMENHFVDIAFTSGVLIHIPPVDLLKSMKEIYRLSNKFIVCIEYFSPEQREIVYHGEKALWTNDFGSIWLDNFPLRCLGNFFMWKRITGLDNLMVWVFEKVN